MQRNNFAGAVRQHKQIAPSKLPEIQGGILYGGRVFRGHQRFKAGKIGKQFRRVAQGVFAFILKIAESQNGTVQVCNNLLTNLRVHSLTHDEQTGTGEPDRDQQ